MKRKITEIFYKIWVLIQTINIFSERIPACTNAQGQQVWADVADPDRLVEVVLHDRHLLRGALRAQQAATVPAVVLSGGEAELVLGKKEWRIVQRTSLCWAKQSYQTFLAAVSLTPPRFLGQNIQQPEEQLLGSHRMIENIHSSLVQCSQNGASLY